PEGVSIPLGLVLYARALQMAQCAVTVIAVAVPGPAGRAGWVAWAVAAASSAVALNIIWTALPPGVARLPRLLRSGSAHMLAGFPAIAALAAVHGDLPFALAALLAFVVPLTINPSFRAVLLRYATGAWRRSAGRPGGDPVARP